MLGPGSGISITLHEMRQDLSLGAIRLQTGDFPLSSNQISLGGTIDPIDHSSGLCIPGAPPMWLMAC
jgi:hypothetical protein